MSDTETRRNFLGIPVNGNINEGDKPVPQRPLSELAPLFQAIIEDPFFDSFGWTQYTPYFNDGEPCTFGVGEPWFRTVEDVAASKRSDGDGDGSEDEDDEDDDENEDGLGVDYGEHPTLGKREYLTTWERGIRTSVPGAYIGTQEERYDRARALSEALNGGAFDDVLLEAFGDHARIKVKATGISVDTYEHD